MILRALRHDAASGIRVVLHLIAGFVAGIAEAGGGRRQFVHHLGHKVAAGFEYASVLVVFGIRRIVYEQHDGDVWEFLEGGGPDGFLDHLGLLHV